VRFFADLHHLAIAVGNQLTIVSGAKELSMTCAILHMGSAGLV